MEEVVKNMKTTKTFSAAESVYNQQFDPDGYDPHLTQERQGKDTKRREER
jgi:hypothetical protein